MKNPEFLIVNSDNVKINVAVWDGKGKNILGVHGISSNSRVWDNIAKNLTPEFSFFAIDLRGRGHSEKPKKGYSLKIHCNDIKNVIDALNIRPVVFMGHSLGAYIGIMFSALFPEYVEKLILFDGGGKLTQEQVKKVFESIQISLSRLGKFYKSYEDYIKEIKKAPFLQPWQDYFDTYYRYELEFYPDGRVKPLTPPHVIEEEAKNLRKEDAEDYYPKIECPVYALRAPEGILKDDDILLPVNAISLMKKKIKNFEVIDIEGTNHYSITFHPNKKRDEILRKLI